MEKQVPYIVYESSQSRSERIIHRLIIALIVAVVLLFVSNAVWAFTLHNTVKIENSNGTSNYIGENGTIENGS